MLVIRAVSRAAAAAMLVLSIACGGGDGGRGPYTTWRDYGGSADSMQYSALDAIDKKNVGKLEPAWSYPAPATISGFAFNPLVVGDTMYVVGRNAEVVALEAATGKVRWSRAVQGIPTFRGFNYWESATGTDQRLIFSSDSSLQELDARTGAPIPSFGAQGHVNLRDGLPRAATWSRNVQSNTPGRVFENLVILGSAMGEEYDAPPGDLRAYDVLTGALVWTFHTIPRAGEFGYDTWPPDAWARNGGVNTWGEISIDEARGIAYFPLGSPTYDLYGAARKGTNLFGNCLLALDARTGKRLWHFQAVHHDLWDYDLSAAPKLLTVRHDGRNVDVVAQATKMGLLYVFDRVTGEPLWPIEERAVPQSDVPGEQAWPTQPFPVKPPPFARLNLTPDDVNPYVSAAESTRLRDMLKAMRNEGIFTPPSIGGYVGVPGQFGGANWGATAADPRTGRLYVRTTNLATRSTLTTTPPAGERAAPETRYYGSLGSLWRSTDGLPGFGPPWSEIVAYDLNTGTIEWRAPLGVVPSLVARGITDTGLDRTWRNGPVVTAGGLIFVGSAGDRMVHAYDKDTGKILWERELVANPDGIPAVYEVDGKQFVVFFAGSAVLAPTAVWKTASSASAQGYYAFALR